MKKNRVDQLLVDQGLAADLKVAGSLIVQGLVYTSNKLIDKPGTKISANEVLFVKNLKNHNYVSRAALKLKGAIECFNIKIKDKIALDIGCSTGGFTQVLLENGANKVFAVDVAYGEIHNTIRNDPRVILLERTNARYLTPEQIYIPPDIIVCDASFIGLKTVISASLNLASKSAEIIALIKPQFEAEKNEVEKGGIINDIKVHQRICKDIADWFEEKGFVVNGVVASPIKGMKGNQEFLIYASSKK